MVRETHRNNKYRSQRKGVRKMKEQMQTMDDRQVEAGKEKKTYKTPELTRLGNVKQLTTGGPPQIKPDEFGLSF